MKASHSIWKRILSAVLAIATAAAFPVSIPQMPESKAAAASVNNSGAAAALGLSPSKIEGFDESDREKNPYGKKVMTFSGADELMITKTGTKGNYIVGENSIVGMEGVAEDENRTLFSWHDVMLTNDGSSDDSEFISELALATDTKVLKNYSYTVVKDEDGDPGDLNRATVVTSPNIYLGYKTSSKLEDAITDIVILERNDEKAEKTIIRSKRTYTLVTYNLSGNSSAFIDYKGDLNTKAGGSYLYMYYTKDRIPRTDSTRAATRLSIDTDNSNAVSKMDLNKGTTGKSVYLHMKNDYHNNIKFQGAKYEQNQEPNPILDGSMVNKTVGANFDGNVLGQKKQYAAVAYDAAKEKYYLSICDPTGQTESTAMEIGDYRDRTLAANAGFPVYSDEILQTIQGASLLQITAGDYDNDGIDEIAVYEPKESAPRVAVYKPNFDAEDPALFDINNWGEAIWSASVDLTSFVSLASGDMNNDGTDDLIIGNGKAITIYDGDGLHMLNSKRTLNAPSGVTMYDPSVTVFTTQYGGKTRNFIGVLAKTENNKYAANAKAVNAVYCPASPMGCDPVSSIENYLFFGSQKQTGSGLCVPVPTELVYLNGQLVSPYVLYPVSFDGEKLKDASWDTSMPKQSQYNKFIYYYDFQSCSLNAGNVAPESAVYKTLSYNILGAHSIGVCAKQGAAEMLPLANTSVTPYCYALVNTDTDTNVMRYTGEHWIQHSDPQVLAVLASPPYFGDLMDAEGLSGSYGSSATEFGTSTSSETGESYANTVSAGAYVSFEHDFETLPGVKVASLEFEINASYSWTEEFEETSYITYEESFSAAAGQDRVAFYSIPMECYEYELTVMLDDKGNTGKVKRTAYIPRTPCTSLISLQEYQQIKDNYPELPDIDTSLLNHTLGDPASYPSSTAGYDNVREFQGSYSAVSANDETQGGCSKSQTIAMGHSSQASYSHEFAIDGKVGGGPGDFVFGVSFGYGHTAGTVHTDTSECSFTGTLFQMPIEVARYGYSMSWKLFSHEGSYKTAKGETVKFPIIDYLVKDVSQPPRVPADLRQNYRESTQNKIGLEWDYASPLSVHGFNLYRVSEYLNTKELTLIAQIDSMNGTENEDGGFTYQYIDDGSNADGTSVQLDAGEMYTYCIEAESNDLVYPLSLMSAELNAYTCASVEYPDVTLKGVTGGHLTMYADAEEYKVEAVVRNSDQFPAKSLSYLWQEKLSGNSTWTDIKTETNAAFSPVFKNGEYRCRVTAKANGLPLTVYSDSFTVTAKLRSLEVTAFNASCTGLSPDASVTLKPKVSDVRQEAKGNVSFIFRRDGTQVASYKVPLRLTDSKTKASSAALSDLDEDIQLPEGKYQVSVYYGGSDKFSSISTDNIEVCSIDPAKNGQNDVIELVKVTQDSETHASYFYPGDTMKVKVMRYTQDEAGTMTAALLAASENILITELPGTYQKSAQVTGSGIDAEQNFDLEVRARPITIMLQQNDLVKNEITSDTIAQAEIRKGDLCFDSHSLDKLVSIKYYSANTTTSFEAVDLAAKPVGPYRAALELYTGEDSQTGYYDIELQSSTFSINNKTFPVMLTAVPVNGFVAGTIDVTKPVEYTGITKEEIECEADKNLTLTASPKTGYLFDHWEVNGAIQKPASGSDPAQIKVKTIALEKPEDELDIKAFFVEQTGTVILHTDDIEEGTVLVPKGFVSGDPYQIGTEFTFTMQGAGDYVPDHWDMLVGEDSKKKVIDEDHITVTVDVDTIELYPVFVLAPCKITMDSRLTASYSVYDEEEEKEQIIEIISGDTVPKYSKVTFALKDTASIEADEIWKLNGSEITPTDGSYELTVTEDVELIIDNQPVVTETTTESSVTAIDTTTTTTGTTKTTSGTTKTTSGTTKTTSGTTKTTSGTTQSTTGTTSSADSTTASTGTTASSTETTTTTTPEPPKPLKGDYNGDGEVTVADAVLLARFLAEDTALTDGQIDIILRADPDYDSDGLVTVHDLAALLKKLGE